jgi:hypothetical protein
MDLQPPHVTTLYAQLQELAFAELTRAFTPAGTGRATRRTIKGRAYWYWSGRSGAANPRSTYLGPDDAPTRALVERLSEMREQARGALQALEGVCRAFVAAGGMAHQPAHAKVFEHLSAVGLFRKGVFVVGSHAFVAIGNMLGVRWASPAVATLDLDFARADSVTLAVPVQRDLQLDVPEELQKLDKTYAPVPGMDPREPSTSMLSRRSLVKIDFLTVLRGRRRAPRFFEDLNIAAQPLRFLDYLLGGDPARGLLVGRRAIPVPLPDPARFAFHKLIVSADRPAAFAIKARKDLLQAAELLRALEDVAPGGLASARDAIASIPGATTRYSKALRALEGLDPIAAAIAKGQ